MTAGKPMTKAQMRTFFRDFFKAWDEHDINGMLAHLTDDVTWMHPGLSEPIHGKAAVRTDLEDTYVAFPDLRFVLEDTDIYLSDDHGKAVATWTWRGTMTGRMALGYEPTGKSVKVSGTCVYRLRDGLIGEHLVVFDAMDFMQQLGLMPHEEDLTFKVMLEAQNLTTRAKKALQRS